MPQSSMMNTSEKYPKTVDSTSLYMGLYDFFQQLMGLCCQHPSIKFQHDFFYLKRTLFHFGFAILLKT